MQSEDARRRVLARIIQRRTDVEDPANNSSANIETPKNKLYNSLFDTCFQSILKYSNSTGTTLDFSKIPIDLKILLFDELRRIKLLQDLSFQLLVDVDTEILDLAHCPQITNQTLHYISDWFTNLRFLDLRVPSAKCDISAVIPIVSKCNFLESLNLTLWKDLTDKSLELLLQTKHQKYKLPRDQYEPLKILIIRLTGIGSGALPVISKYCPDLEVLDFRHQKEVITNKGFPELLSACPKIHSLGIGWANFSVQPSTIKLIATTLKDQLRQLDIEMDIHVDDNVLHDLADYCPNLMYLNLKNCTNISTSGVQKLAQGCTNLIGLNLSGCFGLEDGAICSVGSRCSKLQGLSVMNLDINDATVSHILDSCKDLRVLDVANAKQVTPEMVEEISKRGVYAPTESQTRGAVSLSYYPCFLMDFSKLSSVPL